MTDSAGKTPNSSLIRTVTLQRLAAQLEKIEKARRRSARGRPEFHGEVSPGSNSQAAEVHGAELHGAELQESELSHRATSTGIEPLDGLLPDAGFRQGTLVEWLAESGSGDQLALLAAQPALGKDRFLIVIDSEKTFYPPGAAALGIDLGRLILVRPGKFARPMKTARRVLSRSQTRAEGTPSAETPRPETLWALEQTLQSRGVAVTFCRLERLNARVFRRLQLAVERGGGLGFLIRAPSARNEPSWSDVRLWVEPAPAEFLPSGRRWRVEVLRCRRGAAGQRPIFLEYDDATHTVHPAAEPPSPALPKRARRA